MNDNRYAALSDEQLREIEAACESFEHALRSAKAIRIEDCLATVGENIRGPLFRELLAIELERQSPHDQTARRAEYEARFPTWHDDIRLVFQEIMDVSQSHDSHPTDGAHPDETRAIADVGQSVLYALRQRLLGGPRVTLPYEAKSDERVVVQPQSSEMPTAQRNSRYQLYGEIARGGMGAILKGRDIDLGRDLAIKVLLESHRDKPDIVQRFVEEAQIGGQLQHPGIVPVYELGQFADERPFFSMKLVKGQTLSALLDERKSPSDDRAGFLSIFQHICQTLAYAHSRGVIHRDLKPANIMVGAFGEVQVMDWGLAKVLGVGGVADEKKALLKQQDVSVIRTVNKDAASGSPSGVSHTLAGSVMGTPAYMAPEQALGEIDRLDERADVFGLGAILCELLTGAPPYTGRDSTEVFRLAVRGKLEECHTRLDACEAERELIVLAKQCLAAEADLRPRHAGVLAERITGYLASVESRLRASEIQRATEAARAEEALLTAAEQAAAARAERRARRLQLGLAAGVVVAITVAGVAAVWAAMYQSRLKQEALVAERTAVSAREAESKQLKRAEAEKARAETEKERADITLADMQTSRGLLAGQGGEFATAALWFANAALTTPHDLDRQAANRLRACNWLNEAIVPEALLKLPPGGLRHMAFQPHGSLALTMNGTSCRVWDWRYEQVLDWSLSLGEIADAGWSPDGKQLAVATVASEVRIIEPTSGAVRRNFPAPSQATVLEWSPDGTRIAVGGTHVQVWNVAELPRRESDWPHPAAVYGLTFNRSGTRLATACNDNFARVFATDSAVASGPGGARPDSAALPAPLFAPLEHLPDIGMSRASNVCAPVFCDDDRKLVTIRASRNPGWWNVETGLSEPADWPTPSNPCNRSLASSPDGRLVAAAGFMSCLVWSADGASVEIPHPNHVDQAIFDPDGRFLLTTCYDGTARIRPLEDLDGPPITFPQLESSTSCIFSPDGSFVATASSRQAVVWQLPQPRAIVGHIDAWADRFWQPRPGLDGRLVTHGVRHEYPSTSSLTRGNSLSVVLQHSGQPAGPVIPLDGVLYDSCLCSDNRSVAAACVGGSSGSLSLFDVEKGKPLFASVALPAAPLSVAARPGHPQVAVLCQGGQLQVFSTQTGLRVLDLTHDGWSGSPLICRIEYSPDGNTLVSLTPDNFVVVRDAETGRPRYPSFNPVLELGPCRTLAISPDSRWLATGVNGKNVVQVWDLGSGKPAGTALLHSGDGYGIFCVAFSPDSKLVLSGHKDGGLRLWDWKSGQLVVPPMRHPDEVLACQFTPNGRHAITAVRNSTVHVWDLATGKLAAAPLRYRLGPGKSTDTLSISGWHVVASAPNYPVIDLSELLAQPEAQTEFLLQRAELAANLKLELGELSTLEQSQWDERWNAHVAARISPEAEAEALARSLDEAADDLGRQRIARRAIRSNLIDRLLKLRPKVPQLHLVAADELAAKGDSENAFQHRKLGIEMLKKSQSERTLEASTATLLAGFIVDDAPSPKWLPLELVEMQAESKCLLSAQPDGSILAGPVAMPGSDSYTIRCRSPIRRVATLRLETMPHASLPQQGHGWANGNFHLTELRAELRRADGTSLPLKFHSAAADKVRSIGPDLTFVDGPWGAIDGTHATRWDIWPFPYTRHWLAIELAEPLDMAAADELIVQLDFRDRIYTNARLGCFRLLVGGDARDFAGQQLIVAIRGYDLVGFEALAAAYLAAGDAERSVELLNTSKANASTDSPFPDADLANDSITRLLLLARAQQSLGGTDSARATAARLVAALKTKTPPRALQQLTREAATTLGGLDDKQFYALLNRDSVDPESPD